MLEYWQRSGIYDITRNDQVVRVAQMYRLCRVPSARQHQCFYRFAFAHQVRVIVLLYTQASQPCSCKAYTHRSSCVHLLRIKIEIYESNVA